ncbi:MAG TPA: glutamate--tRNA ligase [Armatimonadetes bacterium]|nr:glutamate--tRNA ligase [Armatimonadota bacterium]
MSANRSVRVRMAPSPTGMFHVGSAHTALFNWLFARHHGGVFILRIEDTDRERSTPEAVKTILDGLRWLGLDWDEGPEVGGPHAPYFQSQRRARYQQAAQELLARGLAYRCYTTPEELEQMRAQQRARGIKSPKYDRRHRDLTPQQERAFQAEGRQPVVRFKTPLTGKTGFTDLIRGPIRVDNRELDDFVLLKANGDPTYNFAVVVDDMDMQITHVIRGEDHISNTPKQLLLWRAFGATPPQFAHLPLLLGPDRRKLSKRHGAVNLLDYAAQGYLPEAMFNFLALIGWSPGGGETQEIFRREELVARFRLDQVAKAGAVFDLRKLDAINAVYLRRLSVTELTELCLPYLRRAGLVDETLTPGEREWLEQVMALEQERLKRLEEIVDFTRFFFGEEVEIEERARRQWLTRPGTADLLATLHARLAALTSFTAADIEKVVRGLAEERGLSAAKVIHPTRVAVTGRTVGPGLFELMEVLGQERCSRRLQAAVAVAKGGGLKGGYS